MTNYYAKKRFLTNEYLKVTGKTTTACGRSNWERSAERTISGHSIGSVKICAPIRVHGTGLKSALDWTKIDSLCSLPAIGSAKGSRGNFYANDVFAKLQRNAFTDFI